jgi:microcin C transport system substrate-binding protein
MRPITVLALFFAVISTIAAPSVAVAQNTQSVHAIAMHGEPKYGPDFTHFDYVNPDAPKGGDVKIASTGGFDSFNPFIIKGTPAPGLGYLYETLTVASIDEAFTRYGLIAESMEMPEDRSSITFHLNPKARWHDGKPITADDVEFSFDIRREHGDPQFKFYYANVERVEKLDVHTVKFVFRPGENRELPLIVSELEILPKHFWDGRDFSKSSLEVPLGSGPYKIKAFEANRWIVYERVKDYWGQDLPVTRGHYNFDTLQVDMYRDRTVQLEALKAGAFDFRLENSSKDWATAYDTPAVRNGQMIREEIDVQTSAGVQGFVFNTRRDLFKDRRVRQALGYAFDFERSNKTLFYGQYQRTRSYFENSELAATGLPSPAELEILEKYRGRIPDEVFTTEYEPPKTDGTGRIRKNLGAAVKLLKEAGWTIQNKKLVNAKGEPFVFEILLVSPAFERIALPFTKNLSRLGIEASVRLVDASQYIKRLETFDFDMISFIWGQSLSPGNEQRSFWGSASADQPGSRNFMGLKDPIVDELIELLIAAPDREALIVRCRALDRVLQWGHYIIPQFYAGNRRLAYWNRFGHPPPDPLRGTIFDIWWVDPDKDAALKQARGK